MTRRRRFTAALAMSGACLAVPRWAHAQQPGKVHRLAYVSVGSPGPRPPGFVSALRELGWIEGQNLVVERFYAEGQEERLPTLVEQAIRTRPDLLVAASTVVTRAGMRATTTIPIVFIRSDDAVGYRLVSNLARPGGNVTGFSSSIGTGGFVSKQMQLLLQAAPRLPQMAVLFTDHPDDAVRKVQEIQSAAQVLKIRVDAFNAERDAAFDEALTSIASGRGLRGLLVTGSPHFDRRRARLIEFAADKRLPAIYFSEGWVNEGGLLSYGPNLSAVGQQAAGYIDKILKGTSPGDLPVLQPTTFDLVINRKTARALGLEIPRSMLLSAARVIE